MLEAARWCVYLGATSELYHDREDATGIAIRVFKYILRKE